MFERARHAPDLGTTVAASSSRGGLRTAPHGFLRPRFAGADTFIAKVFAAAD